MVPSDIPWLWRPVVSLALRRIRRDLRRCAPGQRLIVLSRLLRKAERLRRWRLRSCERACWELCAATMAAWIPAGRLGSGATRRLLPPLMRRLPHLVPRRRRRGSSALAVSRLAAAIAKAGELEPAERLLMALHERRLLDSPDLRLLAELKARRSATDVDDLLIGLRHLVTAEPPERSPIVEHWIEEALAVGPEDLPADFVQRGELNERAAESPDLVWPLRHLGWLAWHSGDTRTAFQRLLEAAQHPKATSFDRFSGALMCYLFGRPGHGWRLLHEQADRPGAKLLLALCIAEHQLVQDPRMTPETAGAVADRLWAPWHSYRRARADRYHRALRYVGYDKRGPSLEERVVGLMYRLYLYAGREVEGFTRPRPGNSGRSGAWRETYVLECLARGRHRRALEALSDVRKQARKAAKVPFSHSPPPEVRPLPQAALLALALTAVAQEDKVRRRLRGVVPLGQRYEDRDWRLACAHLAALRGEPGKPKRDGVEVRSDPRRVEEHLAAAWDCDEARRRFGRKLGPRQRLDRELYAGTANGTSVGHLATRRAWAELIRSYVVFLSPPAPRAAARAAQHLRQAEAHLRSARQWNLQGWVDYLRACLTQRRATLRLHLRRVTPSGSVDASTPEREPWPLEAWEAELATAAQGGDPTRLRGTLERPVWRRLPHCHAYWAGTLDGPPPPPPRKGRRAPHDRYWEASDPTMAAGPALQVWPWQPAKRWAWAEYVAERLVSGGQQQQRPGSTREARAVLASFTGGPDGWRASIALGMWAWGTQDWRLAGLAWEEALHAEEFALHHPRLAQYLAVGAGLAHWAAAEAEAGAATWARSPIPVPTELPAAAHVQAALARIAAEGYCDWYAGDQLGAAKRLAPEASGPWLVELLLGLQAQNQARLHRIELVLDQKHAAEPTTWLLRGLADLEGGSRARRRLAPEHLERGLTLAQELSPGDGPWIGRVQTDRECYGGPRWWWCLDRECRWRPCCGPPARLTEELEHWARTQERGLGARTAFGDAEEDRVLAWPLDALVQPLEPGRLPEEALGLWREITNQPTPNHTALPV